MTVLIIQSVFKDHVFDGSCFLHKCPLSTPKQLITSTENVTHSDTTAMHSVRTRPLETTRLLSSSFNNFLLLSPPNNS